MVTFTSDARNRLAIQAEIDIKSTRPNGKIGSRHDPYDIQLTRCYDPGGKTEPDNRQQRRDQLTI